MNRIRLVGGILIAVLGGLAGIRRRLGVLVVVGVSMEPTFHSGDRVLYRRTRRLRPGQVVVLDTAALERLVPAAAGTSARSPGLMIKRLAAVAGGVRPPQLAEAAQGVRPPQRAEAAQANQRVSDGRVVVLGDNPRSLDSRQWGEIPAAVILGVVVRTLTVG